MMCIYLTNLTNLRTQGICLLWILRLKLLKYYRISLNKYPHIEKWPSSNKLHLPFWPIL